MRQGSKRMLLAVLLLGLSGCTAQEWERVLAGPPRYLVTVPTDTQLSCDEIEETREQVLTAMMNAYQNGNYEGVNDLALRSKYLRGLYARKSCAELVELQAMQYCLDVDRASREGSGYSLKEYIHKYGITPKLADDPRKVTALTACLDILP